jgi:lipid-A-disaccharide synthase
VNAAARVARAPGVGGARRLMLVAGEASGDAHGAILARALRAAASGVELSGMGGARMAAAGVELLADVTRTATMGTTEAVGAVRSLWRAFRRLRAALEGPASPAALVIIDFPEFNLRLAAAARRRGVPVVYFVPPQVWAWRGHRVRTIARRVTVVLAAFPFERALYERAGVAVHYVGHPVLDSLAGAPAVDEARRRLGIDDAARVVGLLPGSRREEVRCMLPVMRAAAARLARVDPGTRFVLAQAPTVDLDGLLSAAEGPAIDVCRDAHAVMRAADLLLVASGTATLEAALLGTPMVVAYRVSRATELLARATVRVPWISLVNIVLGRAVVPELYQDRLSADAVVSAARPLLDDPGAREAQRRAFRELADELGGPGVGARAARVVLATAGMAA